VVLEHRPLVFRNSLLQATADLPYIPPVTVDFWKLPINDTSTNSGLWHVPGVFSIGFAAEVEIFPRHVPWNRIEVMEQGGEAAECTGWFLPDQGTLHQNAGNPFGNAFMPCSVTRVFRRGSLVPIAVNPDKIFAVTARKEFSGGTFTWNIQWQYRGRAGDGRLGPDLPIEKVPQVFGCDATGQASALKKNAGPFVRELNGFNAYVGVLPPATLQWMRDNGYFP